MTRLFFTLLIISFYLNGNTQVIPLPNAHSHNDYEQKRPLKEALDYGFTSVEADVLFIYGKLYVGHNMPDRRWHSLKTLTRQYLKPLYRRYKRNDCQIYEGYEGDFYLWIDIKFEPKKSYYAIRERLYPIREMLNYYENGKFHKGKVTVILSGERPFEALLNDTLQLMTLDGRPSDLAKNYPTELMPFISEHAGRVCQVKSANEVGEKEILRIYEFCNQAKKQNKKTRLWAIPEDEKFWIELQKAGVDLINTDDLRRLSRFLLKE